MSIDGDSRPEQSGRLWFAIGTTSGAQVLRLLGSLIALAITARVLGTHGRGELVAVMSWAATYTALGSMSVQRVMLHRGANADGLNWAGPIAGAAIILTGMVTAGSALVGGGLYALWGPSLYGSLALHQLALGLLLVPLLAWNGFAQSLLVATGQLLSANLFRVAAAFLDVLLIGLLVWLAGLGVEGALVSMLVAQALISGLMLRTLWRELQSPWTPGPGVLRELLTDGAQLHVNTVGGHFRANIDILMLTSFMTPSAVGIYQMGSKLLDVMMVVSGAANQAVWQEMGRSTPDDVWPASKRLSIRLALFTGAAAALAWLVIPYVLPMVVGEEFRPSVWVFRALLPLLFTRMLSSILGPHIVARGWFWQASAVGLALSLGNLLANWVWIPVYGIAGAVLASVAAYGALSLCASIGFWWAIERAATAVDPLEERKGD